MKNKTKTEKYRLVLGLEVHMHLKTLTKMFCGCDSDIYDSEPNTHTCPTCLGLPGALPVPSFEAVQKTQMLGKALNCRLNNDSRFDRKHYFYPDLPKGYQISQYKQPLCEEGYLMLDNGVKVEIERIHLEEDTAKSFHKGSKTFIDFNKSGMPLVELVTKPSFTDVEDAVEFAKRLRDIVKHMGLSDADMEKGQMRIEPNISVRTVAMERKNILPKYKVEVKNINSFRYMEKAVQYEFNRQMKLLEKGEEPIQENRGWNENKDITVAQRSKEEAHDYRYFPEPDIPPMTFDELYFDELKKIIPETPYEIRERLVSQYALSQKNADMLYVYPGLELLEKFEELCTYNIEPETVANLLLNRPEYRDLEPKVFIKKFEEENNKLDDTEELMELAKEVIDENPNAVEDYKSGKDTAVKFLIGQIMRKTKGKADPNISRDILVNLLSQQ